MRPLRGCPTGDAQNSVPPFPFPFPSSLLDRSEGPLSNGNTIGLLVLLGYLPNVPERRRECQQRLHTERRMIFARRYASPLGHFPLSWVYRK